MSSAYADGSRSSTRYPVTPSSTRNRSPPTSAATTGVPHAAASSATRPNDSVRDGHDAHVGGAVVVGELVVRLRRDEPHAALEPELGDQRVQRRDLGFAVGTARAADDHERGRGARSSAASARTARSAPFSGWMRPTKSTQRPVGEPDVAAGRGAVARGEHPVVDAGRDDLDPLGIGAVVAHELVLLLVRRRDDEIRAAHDLGFDAWAQRDRVGQPDLGLHTVERVERGDERQVELVLQAGGRPHPTPSSSRAARRRSPARSSTRRAASVNVTDEVGEVAQRHRRARPDRDVQHPEPGLDVDDRRLLGVLGARAARRRRRPPARAPTRGRGRRRSSRHRRRCPVVRAARCARSAWPPVA